VGVQDIAQHCHFVTVLSCAQAWAVPRALRLCCGCVLAPIAAIPSAAGQVLLGCASVVVEDLVKLPE
jgi:hypothetical protein